MIRRILPPLLLLLLFPSISWNQGGQQITVGPFSNAGLVYVCPVPSGGTPCPSPSSIFSNSNLTGALPNPFSISAQTTVTFYTASGQYTIEMPASGIQQVIGGGGGGATTSAIYLNNLKYGLKTDGQQCFGTNVGTTNTSNIVTCTGANFLTTANTGQVMWATTGCCTTTQQYLGGLVLAESAITSVDSNTQVHVANNATFTCSANATCLLEWGTLNDVAISAAETDGNALTAGCPSYIVPNGMMAFHGKHFNTQPSQCAFGTQLGSAISYTSAVIGQGPSSSIFLATPGLDNASGGGTCTTGCLFSTSQISVQNLAVYGGGCGNCGAGSNLINPGQGSQFFNVAFAGYGGSTSGEVGINATGWRGVFVSVDGFGFTGINYGGGGALANNICLWCFVGDTNGSNVIVAGGEVIDIGSDYGGSGAGSLVLVNGGEYRAFGIHAFACPQNGNVMVAANGGNVDLDSAILNQNCTNVSGLTVQNASSIARARGTTFRGNGTGGSVKVSAGTYVDLGGNIYNTAVSQSGGQISGITNSALNTACATGNFALTSGWGTSSVSSVTANGNIQGCHVTITGAAGSAGPVLTWTYPVAPILAPSSCHIVGVSGTLTGVAVGTPGTTTVAFTFAGTPSAQTYVFDVGCP